MTATAIKWTDEALENAYDVLLTADIGYWATIKKHGERSYRITERDGDAVAIVGPAALLAWLTTQGPQALCQQLGDSYHRAAIAAMVVHDWDNVDYDAETADVIIQQMVLGSVVYG